MTDVLDLDALVARGAMQPAEKPEWGAARGHVNAWQCDACGAILSAIHLAHGVTPMFLACREGRPGCQGTMRSAGYPTGQIPAGILAKLSWEWYGLSRTQAKALRRSGDVGTFDHVSRGGLLLRKLTDAGRRAAWELPAPPTTTEQEQP